MNTMVNSDSVFACLEEAEIRAALKFTDSTDMGDTNGVPVPMLRRLAALGLLSYDEENDLFWCTDRMEQLAMDALINGH